MKDLADFSENMQLSEVTHSISNMSVGVSRFSLRKIGTITVNPKVFRVNKIRKYSKLQKLLEEGIRRELRKELPRLLWIQDKEYKAKTFDLEGDFGPQKVKFPHFSHLGEKFYQLSSLPSRFHLLVRALRR